MAADSRVIDLLNEVLTAELTAVNQYFIHGKMCGNWGYERLAKDKRHESIEEMKDADRVIERILYLDGVPNMQRYNPVRVGENVSEMHRLDLDLERAAIGRLNAGIAVCREAGDNGTRAMLEEILEGEERSADHLQAQLTLIEQVGLQGYLAEQIKD
jgi:bacterioferritin